MTEPSSTSGPGAGLRARGLEKRYDFFQLGPLDLDLEAGKVVGLVGANGAGKSTAMACIMGLVRPDAGEISGQGDASWRRNVGFVGDPPGFFRRWTVERNLKLVSRFYPAVEAAWVRGLLDRLQLDARRKVGGLSKGELAKLCIVAALMHDPMLLLLDEPTAHLDPLMRAEFSDLLFELHGDEQRATLFSSHTLTELGRQADELVFLHQGRLFLRAARTDLEDTWRQITYRLSDPTQPAGTVTSERQGDQWRIVSSDAASTVEHLRTLGAERIESTRLAIDRIAVEILRCAQKGEPL